MAKSCHSISKILSPVSSPRETKPKIHPQTLAFASSKSRTSSLTSSSDKDEALQKLQKKNRRAQRAAPRPLISISTADGKWHGKWNWDFALSLKQLRLADLAQDQEDAEVLVSLNVQKHTGFGFSVDGRITTAFKRRCSCCFASYSKEIDTTFEVWVLSSNKTNEPHELPEIGTSDPSVIYVKPGMEADLDKLIQDTIRLTATVKDTCSDTCEKSTIVWQYTDNKKTFDGRWSRLLELKRAMSHK